MNIINKNSAGEIIKPVPSSSLTSCSAICLVDDGYSVFGANLDMFDAARYGLLFVNKRNMSKKGFNPGTTGKTATWISKYGSLSFNLVGYQIAWGGMNEAGLCISSLSLPETHCPQFDERPPVNDHFWNQYILDNCSTIDDVIESESQVLNTTTGTHHLICDRRGNSVVVEWLGGKTIFYRGVNLPVAALTNTIYGRAVNYWRQDWGKLSNAIRYPGGTLSRFYKAADRVKNYQSNDSETAVDYAFDTLKKVSVPLIMRIPGMWGLIYYPEVVLKAGLSRLATHWSIVFDTKNMCTYFRTYNNPQRRYIDLSKLNFTSSCPVKMMDIDSKSSGDVTNEFIDYSHEVVINHYYRFAKYYDACHPPNTPRDAKKAAESETMHYESFRQLI